MATPTTLPATFTAGQVLTAAQMNDLRGAFRVLQVVSTTKTSAFTTTSTSFVDITGLTATITPSSTNSKILVIANVSCTMGGSSGNSGFLRLNGGNASTYIGDAAGSRSRAASYIYLNTTIYAINNTTFHEDLIYLDSPATTSATTYAAQARVSAGTFYVNQSATDTDAAAWGRTASSITVMEISA